MWTYQRLPVGIPINSQGRKCQECALQYKDDIKIAGWRLFCQLEKSWCCITQTSPKRMENKQYYSRQNHRSELVPDDMLWVTWLMLRSWECWRNNSGPFFEAKTPHARANQPESPWIGMTEQSALLPLALFSPCLGGLPSQAKASMLEGICPLLLRHERPHGFFWGTFECYKWTTLQDLYQNLIIYNSI